MTDEVAAMNAETSMEGIRLGTDDALLYNGLLFFLGYGHDLELLKSTYPQAIQPLGGFIVLIRYLRGELNLADLHKLAITLHRLSLRVGLIYKQGTRQLKRSNGFKVETMDGYTGSDKEQQLTKLENLLAHQLIARIWLAEHDRQHFNFQGGETIFQILSDTEHQAWRGPLWGVIYDLELRVKGEHFVRCQALDQSDVYRVCKTNLWRVTLQQDHILHVALNFSYDLNTLRCVKMEEEGTVSRVINTLETLALNEEEEEEEDTRDEVIWASGNTHFVTKVPWYTVDNDAHNKEDNQTETSEDKPEEEEEEATWASSNGILTTDVPWYDDYDSDLLSTLTL